MGHSFPPDPGGAGEYGHSASTTKTGEGSEAEGARAVARNKEVTAPSNKFKLAHFQRIRPRSGAHSSSQDRHCEPLAPRPMAVDNDEGTRAFITPTPLAMRGGT